MDADAVRKFRLLALRACGQIRAVDLYIFSPP